MQGSSINKMLTLDYMQHEPENKYFDRKSVKIFGYKSVWMKFFICLFYKDLLNWGFLDNKDSVIL